MHPDGGPYLSGGAAAMRTRINTAEFGVPKERKKERKNDRKKERKKAKPSFRNLRSINRRQAARMQPTGRLLRITVLELLHIDPFLLNSDNTVFVLHPHAHTR